MNEILVYEFSKNSREKVRAVIRTWNGKQLIDIRAYYKADGGDWKPTAKGLCLRQETLPDLVRMVETLGKVSFSGGK